MLAMWCAVKREQVWKSVSDSLRGGFGKLLDVRDVRRVRRVSGDAWVVTVALAASSGDLHVADVTVDDAGVMTPALSADHVIDAVRRAQRFSMAPPPPDELADFGDLGGEDEEGAALEMLDEVEEPIEVRVAAAIANGDPASLETARSLLPRLLADHERRGATLFTMAEVELKLGEQGLARGYLEAAAREFADRFDLPALEKAAALALAMVGREAFAGSPIHGLLEQSRARLKPLQSPFDARSFTDLTPDQREDLGWEIELRTLAPEEMLVTEGEPSRNVFVVKSGLLGVWLEKPSGGSWMVRCCFPGWLLGESSVLGRPRRAVHGVAARRARERGVDPSRGEGARHDGRGPRLRPAHRRDQAGPPHRLVLLDARDDGPARRAGARRGALVHPAARVLPGRDASSCRPTRSPRSRAWSPGEASGSTRAPAARRPSP